MEEKSLGRVGPLTVVSIYYNLKIAEHSDKWKILKLISQNYWWPQISRYVAQYVVIYNICLYTKLAYYLSLRELHLLLIPNARWEIISINFVIELSEFTDFDTVIMVIVIT